MKVALTGATGFVGPFVHARLLRDRHDVTVLGRRPVAGARHLPFTLGEAAPDLAGYEALVHLALEHLPGRYRGGEGKDPERFRARNLDGTRRLFSAAKLAGLERVVFLSSRAVYGPQPPGTTLSEATLCRPETEYGRVKLLGEQALAETGLVAASLRATGVYGPAPTGGTHKWAGLFGDFLAGHPLAPRVATEVHGDDLAAAVALALEATALPPALNVSDIVLDRRDLLAMVAEARGVDLPLPYRSDPSRLNVMQTDHLRALGWRPGGSEALRRAIPRMV